MNKRRLWSSMLKIVGSLAMVVGSLDPMEGSLLILPGSAFVTLGVYLGEHSREVVRYWVAVFILIALGVVALFGLSAVGGFGGESGVAAWWGALLLPYPIGWLMALGGGIVALMRKYKVRGSQVHS